MYILPETKEGINALMAEVGNELAYSTIHGGFICNKETYDRLDVKYHFNREEEDSEYSIWDLADLLDCDWEGEDITLHSAYGHKEQIEHCVAGDAEVVLMTYEDESYDGYKDNIRNLFESEDWYKYLLKEVKILMLDLILDSIKMDVRDQIQLLENNI